MEQPWNHQREGGVYAMGESSRHADLDHADLMDLIMEDLPSSDLLLLDGDVDRQLSHVIRSLEAEIGGGADEPAVMMAGGGGESLERIEDVLTDDMDGYDYEEEGLSSFGYWPQVSSSPFLAGHDESEGWCVYTNTNGYEGGGVPGYDTVDHHHQYYYTCAEGSAEHMYLPLWE